MTEEGHRKYQEMEGLIFASRLYEYANWTGEEEARSYRERYPGVKGETLARETQKRYQCLANEHTAYYTYSWGYQKLRNLITLYPFTLGALILITLASLFSHEYSPKLLRFF